MSTPEHIKRIIERLEPVDQVAMEAYLAEMEGATRALLADNRDLRAYLAQQDQTIAELRQEMRERSAATIRGMAAAKRHGCEALAQAQRIRAECSPEALESEREANAILTGEVERLEQGNKVLATLGVHINQQDNRCTADPLFCVFEKEEVVVEEGYGHDRIVWVDDEGIEASPTRSARLEALHQNHRDAPEGWRRLAIAEKDRFVTACFTEQGCKDFLAIQGHNLRKPFTYVTSLFRNKEMIELRNMMMAMGARQEAINAQPDRTSSLPA